ncbi:MAG: M23 family metallopeptidase, partial [Muribaculaceae bacterium]|nr:M23 family metallopeptidase [Muribaculaceae bacterium]
KAKTKEDSERKVANEGSAGEKTTEKKKKQVEQTDKRTDKTKESGNKQVDKQEEVRKEDEKHIDVPLEGSAFANLRGRLPRPVDGPWRITNAFGRHSMPELPEVVYDNPGIDSEVTIDTPVKSVCAGKVSGVYKVAGYGTVVIVNHGEYYTVYGNLSSANVAVGTQVSTGSKVGNAGHDPDDSRRGSVHFEVWKGREKQNPSAWIR